MAVFRFFPELFSWTLKISKIKKDNPYKVGSGKTNLVGNILAAKAPEQVQTHKLFFQKEEKNTLFDLVMMSWAAISDLIQIFHIFYILSISQADS